MSQYESKIVEVPIPKLRNFVMHDASTAEGKIAEVIAEMAADGWTLVSRHDPQKGDLIWTAKTKLVFRRRVY